MIYGFPIVILTCPGGMAAGSGRCPYGFNRPSPRLGVDRGHREPPATARQAGMARRAGFRDQFGMSGGGLSGRGDLPELCQGSSDDPLERCLVRIVDPLLKGDAHDDRAHAHGESGGGVVESPRAQCSRHGRAQ